jgi:hypothetical protein
MRPFQWKQYYTTNFASNLRKALGLYSIIAIPGAVLIVLDQTLSFEPQYVYSWAGGVAVVLPTAAVSVWLVNSVVCRTLWFRYGREQLDSGAVSDESLFFLNLRSQYQQVMCFAVTLFFVPSVHAFFSTATSSNHAVFIRVYAAFLCIIFIPVVPGYTGICVYRERRRSVQIVAEMDKYFAFWRWCNEHNITSTRTDCSAMSKKQFLQCYEHAVGDRIVSDSENCSELDVHLIVAGNASAVRVTRLQTIQKVAEKFMRRSQKEKQSGWDPTPVPKPHGAANVPLQKDVGSVQRARSYRSLPLAPGAAKGTKVSAFDEEEERLYRQWQSFLCETTEAFVQTHDGRIFDYIRHKVENPKWRVEDIDADVKDDCLVFAVPEIDDHYTLMQLDEEASFAEYLASKSWRNRVERSSMQASLFGRTNVEASRLHVKDKYADRADNVTALQESDHIPLRASDHPDSISDVVKEQQSAILEQTLRAQVAANNLRKQLRSKFVSSALIFEWRAGTNGWQFLYAPFEAHFWWWQLLLFVEKTAMVFSQVYFQSSLVQSSSSSERAQSQTLTGLLIQIVMFVLSWFCPYWSLTRDFLTLVGRATNSATAVIGFLIASSDDSSHYDALLFALNSFTLVVMIAAMRPLVIFQKAHAYILSRHRRQAEESQRLRALREEYHSELFLYAQEGNLPLFRQLFSDKRDFAIDVNTRGRGDHRTIFSVAVENNHLSLVRFMLENCFVDAENLRCVLCSPDARSSSATQRLCAHTFSALRLLTISGVTTSAKINDAERTPVCEPEILELIDRRQWEELSYQSLLVHDASMFSVLAAPNLDHRLIPLLFKVLAKSGATSLCYPLKASSKIQSGQHFLRNVSKITMSASDVSDIVGALHDAGWLFETFPHLRHFAFQYAEFSGYCCEDSSGEKAAENLYSVCSWLRDLLAIQGPCGEVDSSRSGIVQLAWSHDAGLRKFLANDANIIRVPDMLLQAPSAGTFLLTHLTLRAVGLTFPDFVTVLQQSTARHLPCLTHICVADNCIFEASSRLGVFTLPTACNNAMQRAGRVRQLDLSRTGLRSTIAVSCLSELLTVLCPELEDLLADGNPLDTSACATFAKTYLQPRSQAGASPLKLSVAHCGLSASALGKLHTVVNGCQVVRSHGNSRPLDNVQFGTLILFTPSPQRETNLVLCRNFPHDLDSAERVGDPSMFSSGEKPPIVMRDADNSVLMALPNNKVIRAYRRQGGELCAEDFVVNLHCGNDAGSAPDDLEAMPFKLPSNAPVRDLLSMMYSNAAAWDVIQPFSCVFCESVRIGDHAFLMILGPPSSGSFAFPLDQPLALGDLAAFRVELEDTRDIISTASWYDGRLYACCYAEGLKPQLQVYRPLLRTMQNDGRICTTALSLALDRTLTTVPYALEKPCDSLFVQNGLLIAISHGQVLTVCVDDNCVDRMVVEGSIAAGIGNVLL